jgi:hypothetical protein
MLTRLAASIVSFGLLTSSFAGASANDPEHQAPVALRMPVRLEVPSKAEVIKALKARRAHNLASFRAYRKGGVYPHNTVRPGPLNIWIDVDGHLCAAATMVAKDGKRDLVNETATTNNNIRLLDVTKGALMDWMVTSGFTIEEIDRIQMPDFQPEMPAVDYTAVDAQLAVGYAKTDGWLVKNEKSSLEVAARRLLQQPFLARALVDGTL